MVDDQLRELERAWRDGGRLADGQRFLHALERAGADDARQTELRRALLTLQLSAAGVDVSSLANLEPIPEGSCFRLDLAGTEAVATWKAIRRQVDETGYWPVLLGPEVDWLHEALEVAGGESALDVLAAADDASAVWLHSDGPEGEWPPNATPRHRFAVATDLLSGEHHDRVVLALIPTRESAQAPAWLRFGGWNACPHPAEHVKALRRWHDRYGAEVLAVGSDTLECYVEHPPTDRRDAMALAREQRAYCDDIVSQGLETLAGLAGGLLGGTAWFFWWD